MPEIQRRRRFAYVNANEYATLAEAMAAVTAGGTLWIPKSQSGRTISAALAPTVPMRILIDPSEVIEQATKYTPVFDLNQVDDVTIQGGYLKWTGSRSYTGGGSARGGDDYLLGSAVWVGGDRNIVRDVRASGFTCGVFLSAWNGTNATTNYQHKDNLVENLTVDTVDFGVLAAGQDRMILRNIRGSYTLQSTSPNPPHLIYVSGGADNRDILIDDCAAYDSTDSYAYQIKETFGGAVGKLVARNCAGILSIRDCTGLTVDTLVSTDDAGDAIGNGSLYFQTGNEDIVIRQVFIDMADESRVVRLDGTSCAIAELDARTIRSTATDNYDVTVQGTRNRLDAVTILNSGAGGCRAICVTGGSDHTVRVLQLTEVKYGVEVQNGITNCTVDIDPKLVTFSSAVSPAALVRVVDVAEPTTSVRSREQASSRTVAAGAISDTVFEPARYSHILLTVGDNTGFTIGAPIEPYTGALLTFEIFDSSAGMGSITWNGTYTFRTAWANPAAGAKRSITFRYDGSAWQEVTRSG